MLQTLLRIWFLIMIFNSLAVLGYSQKKINYDLKVSGTTIAYNSLSDKVLIPGGYQVQTFLFRINKLKSGHESSKYIFIQYFHIVGKPLVEEISNNKLTSKFNLERKADCDRKISDFTEIIENQNVNLLKPLTGNEGEFKLISMDQLLPCYRLYK